MKLSTHFTLAQLDRYQTCKPMMVSGGNFVFLRHLDDNSLQQKCIQVGCVPPTLYRTRRVLCPGAICPGGSLPKGVIVQGVSVQRSLSPGKVPVRETPSAFGKIETCEIITLPQISFAGGKNDRNDRFLIFTKTAVNHPSSTHHE